MDELKTTLLNQSAFNFMIDPVRFDGRYKVGVVGATGAVGGTVLQLLHERKFSISELHLFASQNSEGRWLETPFGQIALQTLKLRKIPQLDFVFMAAGGAISKTWARRFARQGAVVIDKSAYFRDKEYAPLIVPHVNGEEAAGHSGIIANPNCTTIPFVTAMAPLDRLFRLMRVVMVSFQSVSGQGRYGVEALSQELESPHAAPSAFAHRIAHNVIPWIGSKGKSLSGEEHKMIYEARRILNRPRLSIRPTAVRVPTFVGHCIAVHADFESKVNVKKAMQALEDAPGITVMDNPMQDVYPTPLASAGKDTTYVGRIRQDFGKHGLSLWIVADNLRTGAATNAVRIAETVIRGRNAVSA